MGLLSGASAYSGRDWRPGSRRSVCRPMDGASVLVRRSPAEAAVTYPVRDIDDKLLEYCTERQRKVLLAIREHKGLNAASRALGLNKTGAMRTLNDVKKKAAAYGYSPEHDLIKPIAPGFMAKGHSTAYDLRKPGAPAIIQWVKTQRDEQQQEEIVRAAVQALMDDVPRAKPAPAPDQGPDHLCTVYTITDAHVGMRSWHLETGADWDLQISEKTLCRVFDALLAQSPPADKCVVSQLGDYLHFDSLVAETPSGRHPVDADSRYSKIVRVAVRVLRYIVDAALRKHRSVSLLVAEGNHDMAGSVWLRQMMALLYENEPRLSVIDSELPYYVFQHGRTMIGWHHGHLKKREQLPGLFAAQYPQVWGATTKRYIHTGHYHHVHEQEHPGVHVIQHPTLAARDSYAARGGWVADRQATSITYHSAHGQAGRVTVTPEMVE